VKDLVDRRVVALGEEDGKHDLTLGGDFLAAASQGFLKFFAVVLREILNHSKLRKSWNETELQ
jgi:hypothetical protein